MKADSYIKEFMPYGTAAFLVGIVGGFSTVLGPAFVQDINIPYNNTTWTALSQAISTAAFAPVFGKIGDAAGLRKTLLYGIAIYTAGNILSALSASLLFMMVSRFIVGIGSAAITPMVLAYIVTKAPKDSTGKLFSLYMLISSASVILGPSLGSIMINTKGWRFLLWICTAVCILIFIVCFTTIKKTERNMDSLKDFDYRGSAVILILFGLILCVPSFGQNFGWSSPAFLSVALGAIIFLFVLIRTEKASSDPILSGRFMKRKEFILPVLALFLTQGLMQANMTNIIIFVNYTLPENSVISGYAISVMYLGMSFGAVFIGPLADRFEPRYILTVSLLITGAGCASMFFFVENTPAALLALSLGLLGFGLGGNAAVFLKVVLTGVPAKDAGSGTGTYGLFRDITAPFGVAVFVPMFTNSITSLIANGISPISAAVSSVKVLASVEIICAVAGVITVMMLPKIHHR